MTSDRAGNRFRDARLIVLNSQGRRYRDWIARTDPQDFYRFRLNQRSSLTLSLKSNNAKVKGVLLKQSGQILQTSKRHNHTESIAETLEPGVYYLRVNGNKADRSAIRYTLRAAASVFEQAEPIQLPTLRPDLKGNAFATNSNLVPGGLLNVYFGLQNDGPASAPSARIAFYLSGDRQITAGDRLLGTYDLGPMAANSSTGLLSQSFTLPDLSSNFFWNGGGNYYVGMIVDSLNAVSEANETNNANTGSGLDGAALQIQQTSVARSFNIQFDYRFDTQGWFTPERKAALEAAANVWETILQDEFPDVAAGTEIFTRNPQPIRITKTDTTITQEFENTLLQLDQPIDDVLIFVAAGDLGSSVLGLGGASLSTAGQFGDRWQGNDFEPWVGSITFNSTANWFIDPTPSTADDIPTYQNDLISVAVHEMAHVLGFSTGSQAYDQQLGNQSFNGPNAVANNGGQPIPMEADGLHIRTNYKFGNTGLPLMTPLNPIGTRLLPTVLDVAILDDIGYLVNYSAASQNPT